MDNAAGHHADELEEDHPPYLFTIMMGVFLLILLPNLRYLISYPSYDESTFLIQEGLEEQQQDRKSH